ncbi:FAD-dependent oxidoreductase [Candidatus Dependentiae bacterium]|nr:FAD-dependent oxidoreductase [Candidatus Dependentiae bacterium]
MQQITKFFLITIPISFLFACYNPLLRVGKSERKLSLNHLDYSLERAVKQENVVPVVIIGSGPAGLSAALYLARAGMKAFIFAGAMPLGQLTQTTYVENWPGREKVLGPELMNDMKKQAQSFGSVMIHDVVTSVDFTSWPFNIKTEEGREFKALSIILATGATPRRLNVPGEQEYWGKGVTTCAVCDARFFKDKDIVIVGGGDSAVEMVFELSPYVKSVKVLVRKGHMKAAAAGLKKIESYPNASIEYHKEVTRIYGDGEHVTAIDVYDNEKESTQKVAMDGVFLAVGHDPNNKILSEGIALDKHGYLIMKDRTQEASVPGVFAAGEIQDPYYRQAIVAAGEGAKAALDTTSFLYEIGFNSEIGAELDKNFFEHFSDVKKELQEITTTKELEDLIMKAKGVVALDFYSLDCPCCIQMLPHLEAVAHKLDDRVKILKANYTLVKKTIYRDLALDYDIRISKLPSLLVFKDGKIQDINTKVMNKKQLYAYLAKFLDDK